MILQNYKPLLRMEERVSIRPLQMETVRGPNGLETTMWARRAASAIKVEWASGRVSKVKVDSANRADGPCPQWVEEDAFFGSDEKDEVNYLYFSDHKDNSGFKFTWASQAKVYPLVVSREFRYLLGTATDAQNDGRASTVVVVDKKQKKLADEIPVPAGTASVYCIFDTSKQYLALLDSGWQWIMMFDLQGLAERDAATSKSALPAPGSEPSRKDGAVEK